MPPPLPFPYPLRVGTDLCRIPRILRILQGKNGSRFIHRILAPEELVRVRPVIRAVLDDAANSAAKATAAGPRKSDSGFDNLCRWAAKEAAFKAHPHLRLGFHDVLILSPAEMEEQTTGGRPLWQQAWHAKGAPVAVIKPGEGRRDQIAMVSISHDGNYASAVSIGFEPVQEGGDREQGRGWFSRLSRLWS
ncbi:hypothetical protein C8A03DRAFT_12820 [Achaetomium macrosporum]|uniref:4'-phosphopantetheinyl transferase domain-containing protein n=1 Tax=Achaetomium macrosporum TaxID=79813 RepID=A0AAN7CF26_9PEZI|nr:hypothetical protein C8A03DRAFT_12820 [Achaetomium macrosporum]